MERSGTKTTNQTSDAKEAISPKGHPIWGALPDIRRDRLGYMRHVSQSYGDVVRIRVLHLDIYNIFHPEGIQRVLQGNHRNYIKGKLLDNLRKTAGNGLFTSEGDFWLRQRRLMQPAFHRRQIENFADLMTRNAKAMVDGWENRGSHLLPLDVADEMTHLTMAIVTQALFGTIETDENNAISEAIATVLADVTFRFDSPFYPPYFVPTPRNRRFKAAQDTLDKVIYNIINNRRMQADHDREDLLAMLLMAQDEDTGARMDDRQLRDEMLTMFIAGHETTALNLTWTIFLLSQHPEIEARLEEELNTVLNGRLPSAADLPQLQYTKMVLDESMRLYPPAWIFNRQALEEDVVCGYRIPAGANISISPYAMHHHPAYWEDPERFDPERFTAQQNSERPRFMYLPFGGGPRQCIGNRFAEMEAQLILAMLVQRYRFEPAPDHNVIPEPKTTLRPRDGLPMILHKKSG